METSLADTKHRLTEQMLRFLWRQWSALGVAGQAETGDHWVIDPEALLLVSSEFARYDARLFDEILDWLHINGNLINLKRVFNIRKHYPIGNPNVMLAIAKTLQQNTNFIKWKSVSETSLHTITHNDLKTPADGLQKLFPRFPHTMESLKDADKIFQSNGLYRPKPELRGMSLSPSPHSPTNLIFKMRALFGCNSRAEIMTWLLTHDSGHPAQIARDTGYFSKSVQSTLNEMVHSGVIIATRTNREKHFRIMHRDWIVLYDTCSLADNPPKWLNWQEIFTSIQLFHNTASQQNLSDASPLYQALALKETIEEHPYINNYLTAQTTSGTHYLDTILKDFQRLLNQ